MDASAIIWAKRESQPFVDLIMSVKNKERPTVLISSKGFERINDGLSESDRSLIVNCEAAIRYIYERAVKMCHEQRSKGDDA